MKREWGQPKTLELQVLGQGSEGVTRIREAGWSGELHAARLDGIKWLHEAGAFERPGTYVAVRGTIVHSVGSSEALIEPYAEGELRRRAVGRVVVLTSCDGSLTKAEMGYVESYLADKAGLGPRAVGAIGATTASGLAGARLGALGDYVERAMFIMSFMGIDFRASGTAQTVTATGAAPSASGIRPRRGGRIGKREAMQYLREHGIPVGEAVNIATLSKDGAWFWINPRSTMLERDWYIILNDDRRHELIALNIPPNTLRVSEEWERGSGVFLRRDRRELLDLHLDSATLQDSRSGTKFSAFVVGKVGY